MKKIIKITYFCAILMMATMFMLHAQIHYQIPPVGAIPGAIDVSPSGAASYSIPIEVPPGTQGIQPNLSIVYNSMSGMGLLGMKWNLAGLSAITRCGQSPYYDDYITPIKFNSNDRLALDGSRLININGTYFDAGTEYATEIEDFTRIVSYGGSLGKPDYFVAYTDDGSKIEYGNNSTSQQILSSSKILSWYINRITDANGNYMTFNYGRASGEIWISSIYYSGFYGGDSYASVEFEYANIGPNYILGKNTYYVEGYGIAQTKLLEGITVKYGDSVVRKYQFNYNLYETDAHSIHLKSIILQDPKGKELNATTITWGDPLNYSNNMQSDPNTLFSNPHQGFIITGDFNGDGYTDYVLYDVLEGATYWKLYTYDPSTGQYPYSGIYGNHKYSNNGKDCFFYNADVNGDGCDELIIAGRGGGGDFFGVDVWSLKNGATLISTGSIDDFYQVFFGDFDGDGISDMLFLQKNDTVKFKLYMLGYFSGTVTGLPTDDILQYRVRVGDFNGDGKSEVEVIKNNGVINVYALSVWGWDSIFEETQSNSAYHRQRLSGDFNGDGITDLLTYEYEYNVYHGWKIYFGKGDGSYSNPCEASLLDHSPDGVYPMYKVIVADFNGDGKDDIMQIFPHSNYTDLRFVYSYGFYNSAYYSKSRNCSIRAYSCNELKNYNIVDFNNDGILDLVTQHAIDFSPIIYYPHKYNNQYEYVKKITDGLGKEIQLAYNKQYLITDVVNSNTLKKKFYFPVVTTLKVSNGIGDLNSYNYKYENLVFSNSRRSILGFKYFTVTSLVENKKNIIYFGLDNSKHIMNPGWESTYYNDTLVRETGNSFEFLDLTNNRFVSYPAYCEIKDRVNDTKSITTNSLYENGDYKGRVKETETLLYFSNYSYYIEHIKTNSFTYETITLNGYQKKTLPKTVLTTQDFGNGSSIVVDTTTYSYYATGSNTGRLQWEKQSNEYGSITTTYENYTTKGLYQKKTVSAQDVLPRNETYTYDPTNRFLTQIKNHLGHTQSFAYNEKTGDKIWEKDANGLETTYQYDTFGNLTQVNYPDGTNTKTVTDWNYESSVPDAVYFTQIFSTGKPTVIIYYDILGREIERWDDGIASQIQYNAKGQVVSTSSPPSWSEYTYDNLGRVIEEKAPYTHLTYSYNKRKITIYDNLRGVSSYKNYDVLGRIWDAKDEGGTIEYIYGAAPFNGKNSHYNYILSNGEVTTIISDLWGNRLSITEPNAGTITSEYNGFNELIKQTDANGNITTYNYDLLGRIITKKYTNNPDSLPYIPSVAYYYDTGNKAIGKLSKIEMGGETAESFTYDNAGRLSSHTKNETGKFSYTYNANGQLAKLKYPGNFEVNYNYTSTGKLKDIRRSDDNSLIYEVTKRNSYHQPIQCNYGNNPKVEINTKYTYNTYGLVTGIKTEVNKVVLKPNQPGGTVPTTNRIIMDYNYTYNNLGLMTSRSDSIVNQIESYTYDKLDRLKKNTYYDFEGKKVNQTFNYSSNGNITKNSQVGNYVYNGGKPHAVKQITNVNEELISENQCDVTYNLFNQPETITEGDYELEFSYGANQQRNKAILKINDTVVSTRYYFNKYNEATIDSSGNILYYNYIYGDNGVVALHVGTRILPKASSRHSHFDDDDDDDDGESVFRSTDTVDLMYYIHTDHVGSYCAITNEKGQVVQRNSFDPWGNSAFEKKYTALQDTRQSDSLPALLFPITARGFTGHEHYPYFKIINMNGRLYDPVIGRFFSPDKYVANSSFTQDFNRYTYARNNPLHYTDPSGQYGIIVGLLEAMSGIVRALANMNNMFSDLGDAFGPGDPPFGRDFPFWLSVPPPALNGGTLPAADVIAPPPYNPTPLDPGLPRGTLNSTGAFGLGIPRTIMPLNHTNNTTANSQYTPSPAFQSMLVSQVAFRNPDEYPTVPVAPNREPYTGFWGAVNYLWTGGISNGVRYNYDGTVAGPAPNMGNPPVPAFKGGAVVKGGKFVQTMGKAKGNMTGNHALQNQQFKDIVTKLNLNSKQAEQLHREISGQGYGYKEVLQLALDLFK